MELFEVMPGYLSGRLRRTKTGNYIAFIDFDTAQNAIFAKNKYNGYNFDTKTVPPNAINLPKHLIKKHGILIDFSRANMNHEGNGMSNGLNGLNGMNGNGVICSGQIVSHNGVPVAVPPVNGCMYGNAHGIIESIDNTNGYFNSLFYSRKYKNYFYSFFSIFYVFFTIFCVIFCLFLFYVFLMIFIYVVIFIYFYVIFYIWHFFIG